MMRLIHKAKWRDNKGIALVMVMVISAISLSIMSALLYMVSSSTQVSGMKKRYKTALEASTGGEGIVFEYIGSRGSVAELVSGIGLIVNSTSTCIEDKLNAGTADWDASCDQSMTIDITDYTTYDMQFDMGDYRVYAKIVNTIEGNSGTGSSGLVKTGVVSAHTGEITPPIRPYLYTIEVDARNNKNSTERARLSLLYQY